MENPLQNLTFPGEELREELILHGTIMDFKKGDIILSAGKYVKVVPIVLKGRIRVFTSNSEKELLLYYIQPSESCIMSFSAVLKDEPGRVNAVAEADTNTLLLPANRIRDWIKCFPELNALFYNQFNIRYSDLIETINHLLFDSLDERVIDFLNRRKEITGESTIHLTHKQIAESLGTAREVITRILKKLESQNLVRQTPSGIDIL
ncbi:MAG TPA: Crp/Fnr family transcriptional regulator [Bacteroidales bacterium]|nr:Crp/Fnr family transcriptional regulator [Bacteroidales bacterium]